MKQFQARLPVAVFMLVALGIAAVPMPAAGQSAEYYELTERLERLQREVQTLQRSISRGAPPGRAADAAASAEVRLTEFEALLRGLERRIETLENERRRDAERVEKLASDLELRLRALERGSAGVRGCRRVRGARNAGRGDYRRDHGARCPAPSPRDPEAG